MRRRWVAPRRLVHRSIDYKRRQFNHREEAFASLWEDENKPRRWVNLGHGILQDLMCIRVPIGHTPFHRTHWRQTIDNRDAAIVATVIQWLGTNVGMDFVRRALERCGYKVIRDPEWDKKPNCCWRCRGRGRTRRNIDGIVRCGWCGANIHERMAA